MPIKYLGATPTNISISLIKGNFLIMPLNGIGKAVAYQLKLQHKRQLVIRSTDVALKIYLSLIH